MNTGAGRLRVLCVIGTRPEAIKMAPVVHELERRPAQFETLLCNTGQHRELLAPMLEAFDLEPDFTLDSMRPAQSLTRLAATLLEGLEPLIRDTTPHWVLAQGDTTTVLAAALAASYQQVAFGHVEAGLRTGDRTRPFPEEIHRVLADRLADACYAPTAAARDALLAEGCPAPRIVVTGNTVIDALYSIRAKPAALPPQVRANHRIVLVTAHRRESLGAPLQRICQALRLLSNALADDDVQIVFPVHLNPGVLQPVHAALGNLPNVSLLEPLPYPQFVQLLAQSVLALTDSGGIQEEAPALGVPVLLLRDTTERPEGVAAGAVRFVGTDPQRIAAEALRLLRDPAAHAAMTGHENLYGDGRAAARIADDLLSRHASKP